MLLLPCLLLPFTLSLLASALTTVAPFSRVTIFQPPSSYIVPRTLYARTLLIAQDGAEQNVLLSTWENYSPEPPNVFFQIFRSTDLGQTWKPFSNITDTVNGWGLRYQPFLYELEEQIGAFPTGTILCAANSIPTDLSQTQIDVYASRDKGRTWSFISHVAAGGRAIPNNGETPVWEPFIMTFNHQIVLYYSDQRDPAHGQKLAHQVTSDLRTWGPIVNDVANPTFSDRPGMTTIAALPNGQFLLTYEYGGAPEGGFAIYHRLSSSPITFASRPGTVIRATTGQLPTSSPYVVWTPFGGVNGTVVVSANSHTGVFVNRALAAPGSAWMYLETNATRSYTRELRVLPDASQILITGGGSLGGSANAVTATVLQL